MTEVEKREQLRSDLERVNFWINNVDQKASLLLAVLGIILSIVCSTNKVFEIVFVALKPIIDALKYQNCIPVLNILMAIMMCICIWHLGKTILFILNAIKATTDPKLFEQKDLNTDSLLHFQSIENRSYKSFQKYRLIQMEELKEEISDFLSQIYINSNICVNKFDNYNKSIHSLKVFLCWSLFTGVLLVLNFTEFFSN